jgi:hypothetical protein
LKESIASWNSCYIRSPEWILRRGIAATVDRY